MASEAVTDGARGIDASPGAAMQHRLWRKQIDLSSAAGKAEAFLEEAAFERAPWLAIGLAAGIAAWFALPSWREWVAVLFGCGGAGLLALALVPSDTALPHLRRAVWAMALAIALGMAAVWAKSVLVGTPPIARPWVGPLMGEIAVAEPQAAEGRVRITLATHLPDRPQAVLVRVNVPIEQAQGLREGMRVRLRARLMPPAPPMLPSGYDFARRAWFSGLAATGTHIGPIEPLGDPRGEQFLPGCNMRWRATSRRRSRVRRAGSRRLSPAASVGQSLPKTKLRCAMPGSRTCCRSAGSTSARLSPRSISSPCGCLHYGLGLRSGCGCRWSRRGRGRSPDRGHAADRSPGSHGAHASGRC